MTVADRLKDRKSQLEQRWAALNQQLKLLENEFDRETRVEEKLRQSGVLQRQQAALAEVDKELHQLEQTETQISEQSLGEKLVREARERELKAAYTEALVKWEEVNALQVKSWDAPAQISRLQGLKARADRRNQLIFQLTRRISDIKSIFSDVISALRSPGDDMADALESLAEMLIRQEMTPAEFSDSWSALRSTLPVRPPSTIDFAALYRRLKHGEIALFLGAELSHQFDPSLPNARQIAEQLAHEVQLTHPPDALSAMAEYFQMSPDHGAGALVRGLHARLPTADSPNPIHALLSRIPAPLLIVSAAHDSLLEAAFARAGKRYVVVSLVINPLEKFLPGQLLLRYSDRDSPEEPCPGSTLSKLEPLEAGYSILFKIRGTCPSPNRQDTRDLASLVLSERSHFAFARQLGAKLPDYLGARLQTRGFWFLGFEPRHWEDRLFAGAILESRSSQEPANVVRVETDEFEAAYWDSRGVRRHAFELPAFVKRLSEASK